MSSLGMNELGSSPLIIDEGNAEGFAREVADPQSPRNGGFEANAVQRGLSAPFSRAEIPRSKWDDLIKLHEDQQSSPDHWRLSGNVPILDQNGFGYCWCYGTVGATMVAYAQQGGEAPKLSAMGPAAQGKQWRNQGGWAGEALTYIERYGIPELDVWPEHKNDRQLPNQESVKRSAAMHGVTQHEELPRNDFNALVSALLDPERPTPVTLGLNWWGHLVYATKVVRISQGKYGIKIANSWTRSWGNDGCGVLSQSKATAFEQIAIVGVKHRVAV